MPVFSDAITSGVATTLTLKKEVVHRGCLFVTYILAVFFKANILLNVIIYPYLKFVDTWDGIIFR